MERLKEMVKECMEQIESENPEQFDEQEAFDIVMEMIVSEAESYTYTEYKK